MNNSPIPTDSEAELMGNTGSPELQPISSIIRTIAIPNYVMLWPRPSGTCLHLKGHPVVTAKYY